MTKNTRDIEIPKMTDMMTGNDVFASGRDSCVTIRYVFKRQ